MRPTTLRLLLSATSGRLRDSLILVAGVAIVLLLCETFRIPEAAVACYVVLFISRTERTSTIQTAVALGAAGVTSAFLVIAIDAVSLSEPALRIVLMSLLSAGALLLYRAARLGPLFFGAGFVTVYGLTFSDSLNRLALAPSTVSNLGGPKAGLPFLLFGPPEEALTHGLLWLAVVVAIPVCVVVILNKGFGIDPADLVRSGLEERLRAVEDWGGGKPCAHARLEALARRGSTELVSLAGLAEREHGDAAPKARNVATIHATTRLMLACLAAEQLGPGTPPSWATEVAAGCRALLSGGTMPECAAFEDPVGAEANRALQELAARKEQANAPPVHGRSGKAGFWAEDGLSATNVEYALKVTFAVMFCYVLNNALDWPGIGTDVVTCFFVSLGTLGESGRKMTLRLVGCLLGGALGIASIIMLMPLMTDIGHLLLVVMPVTFAAAWIACGSERVSYAGWQLALAFYLTVLDGFGPVTDLTAARDRAVGILIGNVVTFAVLSSFWPVHVGTIAAGKLADALAALARLLDTEAASGESREQDRARDAFAASITTADALLQDEAYEGRHLGMHAVDDAVCLRLQSLVIPVSMLAATPKPDPARSILAAWLRDAEHDLRSGRIQRHGFPPAPALPDGPADRARILLRHAFRELVRPGPSVPGEGNVRTTQQGGRPV